MGDDNTERERKKEDVDLISNTLYIAIGILLALGIDNLMTWWEMVKPIKNVNNYLALGITMTLGAIAFFIVAWWYRSRRS